MWRETRRDKSSTVFKLPSIFDRHISEGVRWNTLLEGFGKRILKRRNTKRNICIDGSSGKAYSVVYQNLDLLLSLAKILTRENTKMKNFAGELCGDSSCHKCSELAITVRQNYIQTTREKLFRRVDYLFFRRNSHAYRAETVIKMILLRQRRRGRSGSYLSRMEVTTGKTNGISCVWPVGNMARKI